MLPDPTPRIKLPAFEGPLDLLLFLIRKNEIDIYDIPIESVTRQYVDMLHALQQMDLDLAGEFFVMAATLMEIKSRLLLPRGLAALAPEEAVEGVDPRWALVHQLLEYKKFKDAAADLAERAALQTDLLPRLVARPPTDPRTAPLRAVDRIELWQTFNQVLRRLAEKLTVGQIEDEQVTVADKMEELLALGRTRTRFTFAGLFTGPVSVRVLVATFLAVLELTRLRRLRLTQDEAFADIHAEFLPPPDEAGVDLPPVAELAGTAPELVAATTAVAAAELADARVT